MNDNQSEFERAREHVRAAIINAERAASRACESYRMTDTPKKPINITVEKTGALIVGDNARVSVQVGDSSVTGSSITAEDALELDGLVQEIATGRKVEPVQVRGDLAQALKVPDYAFITKENLSEALRILRSWNGGLIRDAVNNQTH